MKLIFVTAVLAVSLRMLGCATKEPIPASNVVPAATGVTKVSKDSNDNTSIHLKVDHLAPPQNLQPPRAIYVVWVQTPDNQTYNLGQLKVDKELEGELKAVTPFKIFRLVITAEDFPTVSLPSQQVVLTTDVLEAK
ncbi:MAG: hypothetical protein EG822_10375 [Deltaproteobacteria bacterium]|nr:hypothetical protein [Deltaproteobacteria bacterium]TLN04086.1 MAG: hypothetical protein FDZ73_05105 [bacterium]